MTPDPVERRSEFRFPVVVPVEYFKPHDSGILSYSLDLTKSGTFISTDDPISVGSKFRVHLTIPVNDESSSIFRTEGTVVWDKIRPFKSKRNGMGVKFVEPLPETLLLRALAHKVKNLVNEAVRKEVLEERIEKLESELEGLKRLAALGRRAEKILFRLANPILALSGKLEIINMKMYTHKKMLEAHEETDKEEFKWIVEEFNKDCKEIDQILKDYKVISELAHIVEDNKETFEKKLERYNR